MDRKLQRHRTDSLRQHGFLVSMWAQKPCLLYAPNIGYVISCCKQSACFSGIMLQKRWPYEYMMLNRQQVQVHSASLSAALAKGSRADCIQTCSPHVQVSTRVRTCIPYWRALSGGRCLGSSATPFQFLLIIDCQPHPTSYCWWPSFPGRRCSCLEQSARSYYFHTFRSRLLVPA